MKRITAIMIIILVFVFGLKTNVIASELHGTTLIDDANLTEYWQMEGNGNDHEGNINLTATNATFGTDYGKFNQGVHFAGNGYLTSTTYFNPTSVFSLSAWFRYSVAGEMGLLATSDTWVTGKGVYFCWTGTSTMGLMLRSYAWSSAGCSFGMNVGDGQWHHIAIVFDSATDQKIYYYIDGSLKCNPTNATAAQQNGTNTRLGSASWNGRYYTGDYDDYALFLNKKLSSTEVNTLYTTTGPNSAPNEEYDFTLVSYRIPSPALPPFSIPKPIFI